MLEYYKFKVVYDLFMKGMESEAKEQLTELQRRYVALCDENTTLKTQLQEYEDALYLARNLFLHNGCYWLSTGSIKQGPFCATCYDRDGLLMRLSGEWTERHCPSCRTAYPIAAPNVPLLIPEKEEVYSTLPLQEKQRAKVIRFAK